MTVTPTLCNKNGVLPGGAAAMLLDMLTSAILGMLSRPGYLDSGHVSRALTTTYLRPVLMGAKVKAECQAVAIDRRELTRLEDVDDNTYLTRLWLVSVTAVCVDHGRDNLRPIPSYGHANRSLDPRLWC
jgi:uncharacterized protein (TIGR00369 family)